MKTIQDFIDFYEAIPEEKWTVGIGDSRIGNTCAIGHLKTFIFDEFMLLRHKNARLKDIYRVNDGKLSDFQQETPKQRVLAFLRSLL